MVSIAILAGGASRRMGSDKAFLPFLGVPLIQRVIDRVRPLCHECFIIGAPDDRFNGLGLEVIPDAIPGHNALGGLYTALIKASNPLVIVLGCDMPFVNEPLLRRQVEIIERVKVDAVVPRSRLGEEPLHAVYRRQICAPLVERAIHSGERRMISWMQWANIRYLDESIVSQFDPWHLSFENINTPEDLARAEDLARQFEGT